MFESSKPERAFEGPNWKCASVPVGATWRVITRGPLVSVPGHFCGADKPCVSRLTEGALSCPFCGEKSLRWIGYLPVFLSDEEPFLVIKPSESQIEKASTWPFCSRLIVSRPLERTRPCRYQLYENEYEQPGWLRRVRLTGSIDIRPYLLHLWQVQELTEYFGQKFLRSSGKHELSNLENFNGKAEKTNREMRFGQFN